MLRSEWSSLMMSDRSSMGFSVTLPFHFLKPNWRGDWNVSKQRVLHRADSIFFHDDLDIEINSISAKHLQHNLNERVFKLWFGLTRLFAWWESIFPFASLSNMQMFHSCQPESTGLLAWQEFCIVPTCIRFKFSSTPHFPFSNHAGTSCNASVPPVWDWHTFWEQWI